MPNKLTYWDFEDAAKELGCEVAAIRALAQVESGGRGGFDDEGRLLIRYEGHKFSTFTDHRYDTAYSQVSYRYHKSHRVCGKFHSYNGFNAAFGLAKRAALMACSLGMFQPMAFNYEEMGYASPEEMWDDFRKGEREQLLAFVRLIKKWGLADELKRATKADFARIALRYNGADYKANEYDTKMWAYYNKFTKEKTPSGKRPARGEDVDAAVVPIMETAVANVETTQGRTDEAERLTEAIEATKTDASTLPGKVQETVSETIQEGNKQIEKTVTEEKTTFEAKNIPAFIPRFGKQWLLGLIPGGGLLSTFFAYLQNAPQWFVFLLGAMTGIALWKFMELVIKHREKVTDFLIQCYNATANPERHNLIPTSAANALGMGLFGGLQGSRREQIEDVLGK